MEHNILRGLRRAQHIRSSSRWSCLSASSRVPSAPRWFSQSHRCTDENKGDNASTSPPVPEQAASTTPEPSPSQQPPGLSASLHPAAARSAEAFNLSSLSAALPSDMNSRGSYASGANSKILSVDKHLHSTKEMIRRHGGTLWYFHVFTHRHNTHLTLARPNNNPVLSLSCGNVGYRHSARKQFDASFQLAVYTMAQIRDRNLLPEIHELELVYNGFGKGREAVTKVLLGQEGRQLKKKIVKVSDNTKLKFGGTRSQNKRRI